MNTSHGHGRGYGHGYGPRNVDLESASELRVCLPDMRAQLPKFKACETLAAMYLQRGSPIAGNKSSTHRTHRTHRSGCKGLGLPLAFLFVVALNSRDRAITVT
jgi:hypothetical protein